MKYFVLLALAITTVTGSLLAQEVDSTKIFVESVEKSLVYQTGVIKLNGGVGVLTVPNGYRYLDAKQGMYVLSDLYGNPKDSSVLGLLVPEDRGVLSENTFLYTIRFDSIGFVKDDDADDINYDDLLKEQQKETKEANPERIKQGYEPIEFVGWASAPFYDKEKKVLHWAKELKFGTNDVNTLNYNLRILGRKGLFEMNAIAAIPQLKDVQASVGSVISCVKFTDGNKYSDYIPDVDHVAAWTIGGLVAGKILAKVGFFVLIVKFWKFIALGAVGLFAGIRKWWTGRNHNDDRIIVAPKEEPKDPKNPVA